MSVVMYGRMQESTRLDDEHTTARLVISLLQ